MALFQSDFQIVADYFVQMRKKKEYQPSEEQIKHVHEMLELMAVLTADNRFEEMAVTAEEAMDKMKLAEADRKNIRKRMQESIDL